MTWQQASVDQATATAHPSSQPWAPWSAAAAASSRRGAAADAHPRSTPTGVEADGSSASVGSRSPRGANRRATASESARLGNEDIDEQKERDWNGYWSNSSEWQDAGSRWNDRGATWWEEEVPQPWYIDQHDLVLEPSEVGDHRYTIVVLHSCSGGPDDALAFFHRLDTPLRRHIRVVVPCSPIRRESSHGWEKEQNSWFEYDDDSADGNELKFPDQLIEQRQRLLTLLENERRRLPGLDTRRILLWGLSQGVGMALDVALHAPFQLAGVLALRGMALRGGLPDPAESVARLSSAPLKVLAINGERDRMCPPAAARATYEALQSFGVQVEIVAEPTLGHACARGRQQLNAAELRRVNAFVNSVWDGL